MDWSKQESGSADLDIEQESDSADLDIAKICFGSDRA